MTLGSKSLFIDPKTIFIEPKGYRNTMIPADAGLDLVELVRIALYNIDAFDKVAMEGETQVVGRTTADLTHVKTYRQRFLDGLAAIAQRQGWSVHGSAQVAALYKECPPDRIYRIGGKYRSVTRGLPPLGIVVGYRPGRAGGPAEVGLAVLGISKEFLGSPEQPFPVPAEGLEDVTEAARTGRLPELARPSA